MTENRIPVFFDEYQRYQLISQIIEFYRQKPDSVFHILEIGSNIAKHLKWFLPKDEILFTDIELPEECQGDPEFQIADATDLPFPDRSFDFVVASDVLEHLPDGKRKALLSEAYRVSKKSAIIGFPYANPKVQDAERRVNEYYKALKGEDYIWLKEHSLYGLPQLSQVEEELAALDCYYFNCFRSEIHLWETMYYYFFDAHFRQASWGYFKEIDRYYIEELSSGDVGDNCYRVFYALSHDRNSQLEEFISTLPEKVQKCKFDFLQVLFKGQDMLDSLNVNISLQKDMLDSLNVNISLQKDMLNQQEHIRCLETVNADKQARISYLETANAEQQSELERLREAYNEISNAFFWKITKPFRFAIDTVRKFFKHLRRS